MIFLKKSTCFLLTSLFFVFGIVAGFLLSPVKGGFNIGNNSGNNYTDRDETDDCGSDY